MNQSLAQQDVAICLAGHVWVLTLRVGPAQLKPHSLNVGGGGPQNEIGVLKAEQRGMEPRQRGPMEIDPRPYLVSVSFLACLTSSIGNSLTHPAPGLALTLYFGHLG